jgi:alkaline phosphatase D
MLQLIKETKANGVFFISGDVHYGEFSELKNKESYPIFDFTSSGLTQEWRFATPNKNRIAGPIMQNNFGLIEINTLEKTIEVQLRDKTGSIVAEKLLHLEALQINP